MPHLALPSLLRRPHIALALQLLVQLPTPQFSTSNPHFPFFPQPDLM